MQPVENLSVRLPADIVRAIRARVQGGTHADDSAVVREALRAWMAREQQFAAFEAAVDQAIADADAGHLTTSDEIRRILRERYGPDGAATMA